MIKNYTHPKVQFGTTILEGDAIKEAVVVEDFDPISATLPISTLELTLYSTDPDFSLIDPAGDYAAFIYRTPIVIYEVSGTNTILIGQYFLDTWENISDTLIKFKCVDVFGLLDTIEYDGGIWINPVKMGDLIGEISTQIGIACTIDPDLYDFPIAGWIPICSYREAIQHIAFASGASVTSIRQSGYLKFAKNYLGGAISKGITSGVGKAGQSRLWQQRWRLGTWSSSFTALQSGVAHTGQSRNYQRRWRKNVWGELLGDVTITKANKGSSQSLALKTQVTGVEVTAHNIIHGTGALELYHGVLPAGVKRIEFSQPMSDLSITGATVTESGANYAIISVGSDGLVTLSGTVYIDTKRTHSIYMTGLGDNAKDNVIKVTGATLVNSTNADEVASRIYNYYQQRLLQKVKLYAPIAAPGNVVIIDTLYDQKIRGVVEKMSINLAGGFVADAEIVGIVSS